MNLTTLSSPVFPFYYVLTLHDFWSGGIFYGRDSYVLKKVDALLITVYSNVFCDLSVYYALSQNPSVLPNVPFLFLRYGTCHYFYVKWIQRLLRFNLVFYLLSLSTINWARILFLFYISRFIPLCPSSYFSKFVRLEGNIVVRVIEWSVFILGWVRVRVRIEVKVGIHCAKVHLSP